MAAGVSIRAEQNAPPRVHPKPIGGAATSVFAGVIDDLDENTATRGEKWRGYSGFLGESQKMLTDPHVKTGRDVVVNPVVAAEWDFEPGGKRPQDLEAAAFARWVFFDQLPWTRIVGDAMRAYISDGFAIVEKTDDVLPIPADKFPLHVMSKGTGLGVKITGLDLRPGWSVDGWYQDPANTTQTRGVRQFLRGSDEEKAGFVDIPSDRYIRFTWEQVGANYEGNAPQRCVWGPWFVKRMLTRIEAIGHERNHASTPVGMRDDSGLGSEDGDKKLLRILEQFRTHEKGAIVLEPGYTVEWSQHGQQTNIGATIVRCNFDIAHGSGGSGFMMLGQAEGPGSYALAGTQKGQFDLSLNIHADFICTCFNFGMDGWSVVARLIRQNYGEDCAIPKLVVRYLPTVNWKEALETAATLVEKGMLTKDGLNRWARRGLKAPAPAIEENDAPAKPGDIAAGANIVAQVAKGEISRPSGKALLMHFLGVTPEIAESMLGPDGFEAKPPAPKSPPSSSAPAEDEMPMGENEMPMGGAAPAERMAA